MEKISIIVPVYNVENYLNECLDSIIDQTYKNIEIILIDDGSKDSSGKICDEYIKKDKRIKVVHKENGGLSSARNAGLDIASGEYITFIDSDDCVSPYFIEKLYNSCIENKCDIAECDYLNFDKEPLVEHHPIEIEVISKKEKLLRGYKKDFGRTVVVWNKIYKKYLFNSLRFPIGKTNEDAYLTYKVLYYCKTNIAITNEALYYYRRNNNSIMRRKFNVKRLDELEAWKEHKLFYYKNNEKDLYKSVTQLYQERLFLYYFYTEENVEDSNIYLNNIIKDFRTNLKDYLSINSVSFKMKFKMTILGCMPRLYVLICKSRKKMNDFNERRNNGRNK